jgi:hypothetical protein
MRSRATLGLMLALGGAAILSAAGPDLGSQADADALRLKFIQIATNGLAQTPQARETPVTEQEVNAFIRTQAGGGLPEGIIDPLLNFLPDGRIAGRATVDLDTVRATQDMGAIGGLIPLTGRVPVEATGVLRTGKGVGAFTLESVTVGGVPVPKTVLQELVSYYSRSNEQPQGVNIEAPFRLPAKIREIKTVRGQAVIVQ